MSVSMEPVCYTVSNSIRSGVEHPTVEGMARRREGKTGRKAALGGSGRPARLSRHRASVVVPISCMRMDSPLQVRL